MKAAEAEKVAELIPNKVIEDREVAIEKLTEQNNIEASKASILSDFTSSVLRKFLKHFSKLIEMPSERTMEDVSRECEVPLKDAENIAREVTKQCKLVIVVDGKRQSIKIQNIFINSSLVEKIVKFDYI